MNTVIHNGALTVEVSPLGAELQSITGADGTQYLWQGDPAFWHGHAPNLFPWVGRLPDGLYDLDGQRLVMGKHGFARTQIFTPVSGGPDRLVLELRENPETLAMWPRAFAFRVCYTLRDNTLELRYAVENRDSRELHCGLGAHPALAVPLDPGLTFSDYRLRFAQPCQPQSLGLSPRGFMNREDRPYPLEQGTDIPLRDSLFDHDSLILADMCREVSLEAEQGKHRVTLAYPDLDYLVLWRVQNPAARYICVEPWKSLPGFEGEVANLNTRPDLLHLAPGQTWETTITLTFQ